MAKHRKAPQVVAPARGPAEEGATKSARAQMAALLALPILALFVGASFIVATLRRGASDKVVRKDSRAGDNPYTRAKAARGDLVTELLDALASSVAKDEKDRVLALTQEIVREGDEAVVHVEARLSARTAWNLDMAFLRILAAVRSEIATHALERFYSQLGREHVAYKIETARAIARSGGSISRESLLRVYAAEKDEKLRAELAKTLISIGVTKDALARAVPHCPTEVVSQAEQRDKLAVQMEAIEKLDPRTEQGLATLRQVLTSDSSLAVGLAALRRLAERSDDAAARLALDVALREAAGGDPQILQTNALAAVARIRSNVAREALGRMIRESGPLRVQAVAMAGAYGDAVYLPALEAATLAENPQLREAAEQAIASIKTRSAGVSPRTGRE